MMLNRDYPKSFTDIPQHYAYTEKHAWTILDNHRRVHGRLFVSENKIMLNFATTRTEADEFSGKRFNIVTAVNDKSSRMELMGCTVYESPLTKLFRNNRADQELTAKMLVVGEGSARIPKELSNLTGMLPGIGEWFEENFLDFDIDSYTFKNTKIIYHDIDLWEGAKIVLNARLVIDHESAILEDRFVAYPESYVEVIFDKADSIDNMLTIFDHVQNFFNFVFLEPYSSDTFTSKVTGRRKARKLYIATPTKKLPSARRGSKLHNNMLFKFSDLSDFNSVFINWMLRYRDMHEIIDILMLVKTSQISEELRFTAVINALEAVHRRFYDKRTQTDEEYAERVKGIIEKIDDTKDKKLLRWKLKHGNEQSLRDRLADIYALGEEYSISRPSDDLTQKIIDTRNYYTHRDKSLVPKILTSYMLRDADGLLERYLKLMILNIIKVPKAELAAIVASSPQFKDYYRDEPPVAPITRGK